MNRKSSVWEYFIDSASGERVCLQCKQRFSKTSSTSSLRYHLKTAHRLGVSKLEMRRNSEDATLESSIDSFEEPMKDLLDVQTCRDLLAKVFIRNESSEPTIPSFLVDTRSVLSSIELEDRDIHRLEKKIRENILSKMKSIPTYSLVVDTRLVDNVEFLLLSLSGISPNWELECFLLDPIPINPMDEPSLFQTARKVLDRWGIGNDSIRYTFFGKSGIAEKVARKIGEPCGVRFSDALERMLTGSLHEMYEELLERLWDIYDYLFSDPVLSSDVVEHFKSQGLTLQIITPKSLTGEKPLRFTIRMLEQMTVMRQDISAFKNAGPKPTMLCDEEWETTTKLFKLLFPISRFVWMSRRVGFISPLLPRIISHLEKADPLIQTFASRIQQELEKLVLPPLSVSPAIYLDPRMKELDLFDEQSRKKIQEYCHKNLTIEHQAPSIDSRWRLFVPELVELVTQTHEFNEAKLYAKKKQCCDISIDAKEKGGLALTDHLLWWKIHQFKYPQLAELARKHLCANIITEKRFLQFPLKSTKDVQDVAMLLFVACQLSHA